MVSEVTRTPGQGQMTTKGHPRTKFDPKQGEPGNQRSKRRRNMIDLLSDGSDSGLNLAEVKNSLSQCPEEVIEDEFSPSDVMCQGQDQGDRDVRCNVTSPKKVARQQNNDDEAGIHRDELRFQCQEDECDANGGQRVIPMSKSIKSYRGNITECADKSTKTIKMFTRVNVDQERSTDVKPDYDDKGGIEECEDVEECEAIEEREDRNPRNMKAHPRERRDVEECEGNQIQHREDGPRTSRCPRSSRCNPKPKDYRKINNIKIKEFILELGVS